MKYLKLLSVILVYIRNYFLVICPIYKEIILKEVPYFPIVAGMVPHLDHSNFHHYRPNYFHDVGYRWISYDTLGQFFRYSWVTIGRTT